MKYLAAFWISASLSAIAVYLWLSHAASGSTDPSLSDSFFFAFVFLCPCVAMAGGVAGMALFGLYQLFVWTAERLLNSFPSRVLLAACLLSSFAFAQDQPQSMALSPEVRGWYRNPDGSCVQCSIGMAGCHCNEPAAATLLWDTQYGPAVRGGSIPSRVAAYCNERQIKAWNITGQTVEDTMPSIEWAARTGRFAAVGLGEAHFQTLYGFDPQSRTWFVCNNNSTDRIDRYTDAQFRQLHGAVKWVVILERPSSPPPEFVRWWKN